MTSQAKLRSSMRKRRRTTSSTMTSSTSSKPTADDVDSSRSVDNRRRVVLPAANGRREFRSASTPTLCCCTLPSNRGQQQRRCSLLVQLPMATNKMLPSNLVTMRTSLRHHLQSIARAFKRNVQAKRTRTHQVDNNHDSRTDTPDNECGPQ